MEIPEISGGGEKGAEKVLTISELSDIVESLKIYRFDNPSNKSVQQAVLSHFKLEESQCDMVKFENICDNAYRRVKHQKQNPKRKRSSDGKKDIIVDAEDFRSSNVEVQEPPTPILGGDRGSSFRKPLLETSRRQKQRRLESVYEDLGSAAEDQQIPMPDLLTLLLHMCPETKKLSKQITGGELTKLDTSVAQAIYTECGMGKSTWGVLCRILKNAGLDILPNWTTLRSAQKKITPPVNRLVDPHQGVFFKFQDAAVMTTEQVLKTIPLSTTVPDSVVMNFKWGFDGSGSHQIYHQQNNAETSNMLVAMMCPLSIVDPNGSVIWEQVSPNSPACQRPLLLQLGKENLESMQSLSMYSTEIKNLSEEPFQASFNDQVLSVQFRIPGEMTPMDRKASDLYLGQGGAFCDLCVRSREECHDESVIEEGFSIDRDQEKVLEVYNKLVDEDGVVKTARGDYADRLGVTQRPVPSHKLVPIQVLHLLLRCFDWFVKLFVRVMCRVTDWSDSPTSLYARILRDGKSRLQEGIKVKTGIKLDFPDSAGKGGTTTTGNVARRLLCEDHLPIFLSFLEGPEYEKDRSAVSRIHVELSVILRVLRSRHRVNVSHLRDLCIQLYLLIRQCFSWARVTPSLHKLLAHSADLIELNDCIGLGALSEEGLETCHKRLRVIRQRHSRKISQDANITDCLTRMWLSTDPEVTDVRLKASVYCRHCDSYGDHGYRYCPERAINQLQPAEESTGNNILNLLLVK